MTFIIQIIKNRDSNEKGLLISVEATGYGLVNLLPRL